MKMVMIICSKSREEEINALIAEHDIHAYSAIRDVMGAGETGRKMGNHIWPGTSTLIFAILDDTKAEELFSALKEFERDLYPGEGLKAFILAIENVL